VRNFWVAFVVLLSIATGVLFGNMGSKVDESAVKSAQLAQFKDLSGNWRRLSDWDGRYRIVNFWATWCPPCLEEIPLFIALQQEFQRYQYDVYWYRS
jgi:thiol-disulfide isomerase/thioredoxin